MLRPNFGSSVRRQGNPIVACRPQWIGQCCDKRPVTDNVGVACTVRTCLPREAHATRVIISRSVFGLRRGRHVEPDLSPAGQLDINLRKQGRIEKSTMPNPVTAIDPISRAKRIEAVLGSWMACLRHGQRIDHPRHRNVQASAITQLGIQKAKIEHGIVRDQRTVIEKVEQIFDSIFEIGLVLKEPIAEPMNLLGNAWHCHARIEIGVIGVAGFNAVDQFDATDLDDPVALFRIKSGGLGIENDFTH